MLGDFAVDSAVICASMTGRIYTLHVLVAGGSKGFCRVRRGQGRDDCEEKRCDCRNLGQAFVGEVIGHREG
jgi:hypothetical protein